jgi:hypothetical protein
MLIELTPLKEYQMKIKCVVSTMRSFGMSFILLFVPLILAGGGFTSRALAAQIFPVTTPSTNFATGGIENIRSDMGVDELIPPSFAIYLPLIQRGISPTVPAMSCSVAPTLMSPLDNSSLDTLIPQFTYVNETDPISYTVISIADNPAFDTPIEYSMGGGGTGTRQLTLFDNLEPATTYYWRVNEVCGAVEGPFSSVFSFTTGSNGVILAAPNLVSPVNGTVGVGQEAILTWDAVGDAMGYASHVCEKTGGCVLSYTSTTTSTFYLSPNTEYIWYVYAYNDYAYGNQSEGWMFTTGSFSALPNNTLNFLSEIPKTFKLSMEGASYVVEGNR